MPYFIGKKMKTKTTIQTITDRIETDIMLGLLHGFLIPLLLMVATQSRLGLLYLLIPMAVFATVGKDRDSKEVFISFAMLLTVITVASWADASIIR